MAKSTINTPITMEELLASSNKKVISVSRGQEVEGTVISITDQEVTLEIGAKSEGVLPKKDLPQDLKLGDKIKAYVVLPENESGQTVLSLNFSQTRTVRKGRGIPWDRYKGAQRERIKFNGKILEFNKGGVIIETDGVRGFLPNSQIGFDIINKSTQDLLGQNVSFLINEVDEGANKLIFTQKGLASQDAKEAYKDLKRGDKIKAKVSVILPFGMILETDQKLKGIVLPSESSWEMVSDLTTLFKVGQEVEAICLGVDEELGRVNFSIKQNSEDPFVKLAEDYPADEVVKAEVLNVTDTGVTFALKDKLEGFLPASKIPADTKYSVGDQVTLLVDSVDTQKRKVNLAPFVTSTAGLIYK